MNFSMTNRMAINSENLLKGDIWLKGLFGIEKENIRIDKNGVIAQTPHPAVFGEKLSNPYITTDFSESQVEMITPPLPDISKSLGFLETIHDIVSLELADEYLWPQSTPPVLPDEDKIPVAHFNESNIEEEYRKKLAKKYGKKKQALSGIHFNVSLDEKLIRLLNEKFAPEVSYQTFREESYLKITRQILRLRWLYVLLYGNSPAVDKTFDVQCRALPVKINSDARALSFRNSCFGYGNIIELFPDYSAVSAYFKSIDKFIQQGKLSAAKELYALVRPKFNNKSNEIAYLEFRFPDINPLSKIGLTPQMLQFVHLLAIYGLLTDEPDNFSPEFQSIANRNYENVSMYGLKNEILIRNSEGLNINAWDEARRIVTEMNELFNSLQINNSEYSDMLSKSLELINEPEKRDVVKVLKGIENQGFISFHINLAKEYLQESKKNDFNFRGFEDMELSTQLMLREAVRRGVSFEILDRNENFMRLKRDGNIQYIKQATKTSLDNYASILAMENKVVTKEILHEHGIRVPVGMNYTNKSAAKEDFNYYKNHAIVIKPKLTNFGYGITILKDNNDPTVYERAIDIAFDFDTSILIEEFIAGKEFRIFVIDNEVVGILHRVPANVTGNGFNNIRELVMQKNTDPMRGKGYKTPLEKIQLGEAESMFLKEQGKGFEHIPAQNETVFLRENSNISTGGDSIDFTDDIPESYKKIAVKAAKALNVKITGLDMIIKDYKQEANDHNYAIIEMNFNPAIHIHCHPYKGKNRKLNEKLMDALGYKIKDQKAKEVAKFSNFCCCECC